MLARVLKRFRILFSPLCYCTFFGARAPALTRLLHTFSRRERERITLHLITIDLVGKPHPAILPAIGAFQGSEHAIIRLLGDCGRIRTSLRCTIAAKPIHSHGLLVPLTLLNTVEMRPFGNSVSLYLSPRCLHFDSRTRCSTFLHIPLRFRSPPVARKSLARWQCKYPFSLGKLRSRWRRRSVDEVNFLSLHSYYKYDYTIQEDTTNYWM